MGTNSKDSFKTFLESWLDELHAIIDQLQSVQLGSTNEAKQRDLVLTFMEHQESLFLAKRRLVERDPFVSVCLPWINSMFRALQWFGGWRPVAAYRVAKCSHVISQDQEETLEAMQLVTKIEEASIEKEKTQTEIRVIKAFVKGQGIATMEVALKATMEKVALAADLARMEAVKRITGIISQAEAVVFLAELGKMEAGFYGVD